MDGGDQEIFVFNHIEKCGGVSFALYLEGQIRPDDQALLVFAGKIDEFRKKLAAGGYDRSRRLFVYTHFASAVHRLFPGKRLRKLTLLREPWSRFVSAYRFSQGVSFFPPMTMDDFFAGSWHNFMTLTLGDGNLPAAKENLESDYEFFGLTEDFDRSMLMLADTFGFGSADYTHMNRSTAGDREGAPAGMRERFYELNRDDVELHEFAKRLFEKRWSERAPSLAGRRPPAAGESGDREDIIRRLTDNFRTERQPRDSFLFEPFSADDGALAVLWGIFYRLTPLAQMYEILGQGRYRELGRLIDNLEAYHAACPFPYPSMPEFIRYFRGITPNAFEAALGRVLSFLGVDMTAAREKRLGPKMPYGLLNFMDFVDTKTMMDLFRRLGQNIDVEAEIGRLLDE